MPVMLQELLAEIPSPIQWAVFGDDLPKMDVAGIRRIRDAWRAHSGSCEASRLRLLASCDDLPNIIAGKTDSEIVTAIHRICADLAGQRDFCRGIADQCDQAAADTEKSMWEMLIFGTVVAYQVAFIISGGVIGTVPGIALLSKARQRFLEMLEKCVTNIALKGSTAAAARVVLLGTAFGAGNAGLDYSIQQIQVWSGNRSRIDTTSIAAMGLQGIGAVAGGHLATTLLARTGPLLGCAAMPVTAALGGLFGVLGGAAAAIPVTGGFQLTGSAIFSGVAQGIAGGFTATHVAKSPEARSPKGVDLSGIVAGTGRFAVFEPKTSGQPSIAGEQPSHHLVETPPTTEPPAAAAMARNAPGRLVPLDATAHLPLSQVDAGVPDQVGGYTPQHERLRELGYSTKPIKPVLGEHTKHLVTASVAGNDPPAPRTRVSTDNADTKGAGAPKPAVTGGPPAHGGPITSSGRHAGGGPARRGDIPTGVPPRIEPPDPTGGEEAKAEQPTPLPDTTRGSWVAALRHERNLTEAQLAQATHLSADYISEIEGDRRAPGLAVFQRLARALGVGEQALNAAISHFYPDINTNTDPMAHDTVGGWVAALRHDRTMNLPQLAEATDLTAGQIRNVQNGKRVPPLAIFRRLARALGVGEQTLNAAISHFYPDINTNTDPMAHDTVGGWVAALRHDRGVTRGELAETADLTPGHILKIESGKRVPSLDIFRRLCRALNVDDETLPNAVHRFYPGNGTDTNPLAHDAISGWVAAVRHDRGMTRAELAQAADVTVRHVTLVETGSSIPHLQSFRRLGHALEVGEETLRKAGHHFYPETNTDTDPVAHDAVGSWVAALHHDAGMSRAELARAAGISQTHLSDIEHGRSLPGYETFRRLGRALGVRCGTLVEAIRNFYPEIRADIDPATHDSLADWVAALHHDTEMTRSELAQKSGMSPSFITDVEKGSYLPRLEGFRRLCHTFGIRGEILVEGVERFYGKRYKRSGNQAEEEIFWRYVKTRVGSTEEHRIREEIFEKYTWVAEVLARQERMEVRDEAAQAARISIWNAIRNHVPSASFAAHAWAGSRGAILRDYFLRRYPDLDDRTRKIVITVSAQIDRMVAARDIVDDAAIAQATGFAATDITFAREVLSRSTARPFDFADPAASQFSEAFTMNVRSALADMTEPDIALRLVMSHLVHEQSVNDTATQLGLEPDTAKSILAEAVGRLRSTFASTAGRTATR